MPRNGSGSYSLPTNSWNPAQNGVPATAADWQALANDLASALTQSLSRDGQTAYIGNQPMGGNKLTGLGAGSAAGDSLRFEQLFSQGIQQDLASASVVDIGAVNSTVVNITGTTTITSFGTNYNGPRYLRFAGVLTLTHSATLVLPGNANITTAAGDSAIVVPLGNPATGWRVVGYVRQADVPGTVPDSSVTTAKLADDAVTFAKMQNIATARLLGRATAGTGDVEELTAIPSGVDVPAARLSGTIDVARLPGQALINLGTAVNSTSGTAIDFTSIPSWVKRITVMFNGVSTNGSSNFLIQLGDAGGIETGGYASAAAVPSSTTAAASSTAGFIVLAANSASDLWHGAVTLSLLDSATHLWTSTGSLTNASGVRSSAGAKNTSQDVDRIRITTVNGTDAFDAGSINISWE
jgi:hypothetical protein